MLTPSRVKIYCLTIILTNLSLLAFTVARSWDYSVGADLQVFYNAGLIFNQNPSSLYDLELQDRLFESHGGGQQSLPFVYPPWFVLPCAALATLPFKWAFVTWTILSIVLMCGAYLLSWHEEFPPEWRWPGLLAAFAFPAFQFYTLRGGQISAFGCFVLALSFFLRRRQLLGGLALSLGLYKPTLLTFILPMLLITKQWKALAGFALGGFGLVLLSFLLIGTNGVNAYIKLSRFFYQASNGPHEIFQTFRFIDLGSGFRLLTGRPLGLGRVILPVAVMIWWIPYCLRRPDSVIWAAALTCALLFGLYAPIYDASLLVLVVMWSGPKWLGTRLLVILFVLSAVSTGIAWLIHIQLMTLGVAWMLWKLSQFRRTTPIHFKSHVSAGAAVAVHV